MTTLTNNFEGGTSGTSLTTGNSGGASGNAFDNIFIGTGVTLAYDNTRAAHGSLSAQVATGSTATTGLAEWTTSEGTQAVIWFRQYLYFTGNPAAASRPFVARSGASQAAAIGLSTGGKFQLIDGTNTIRLTFTNPIPLNRWFRIEGSITGSATVGVITLSQYNLMDSVVATESETVTGLNNTGSLTQYWFGQGSSAANTGPYWMDSIGVSSTGPLGPFGAASRRSTSIVPSLIAAGAI